MTAAIRVAVEISTNLLNCIFCGGICCVDSRKQLSIAIFKQLENF